MRERQYVGIVGHEGAKFTQAGERAARWFIRELLKRPTVVLVSGHCPLGGIDIWAEEIANELGRDMRIFPPKEQNWTRGYKPRNIEIATHSDLVWVLVVRRFPDEYRGMRFPYCYHCHHRRHIKSGGCWTGHYAKKLGKVVLWHSFSNVEED